MNYVSAPWIWLYVGAFLMLLEVVTPGFVVFFFGLSACTVAAVAWLAPSLPLAGQLGLFSVFSVLYLLVLRRLVKGVFMGVADSRGAVAGDYVGRVGKVVETVRPEVPGRILLGDAEWSAACAERLEPGVEVRVVGQDNLTLKVEKINA